MEQKVSCLLIFLLAVFLNNGCNKNETVTSKDDLDAQESNIIPVEVQTVQKTLWTEAVSAYGNIKEKDKVDIFSKMPGKIIKLLVKEGQLVQNDDLVAIVDRDEVGATYKSVEVKAATPGKVEEIHLRVGSQVSPLTPILSIAKQEELKVVVTPFETDVAKLRLGQKAIIQMDAFPNREFFGKVNYINPNIQTNSGKGEVEITFDKNYPEVLSGMFGRVRILIDQRQALTINPEALRKMEDKYFVYVVRNSFARQVTVDVGSKKPDAVEIKLGLALGDTIVTFASNHLDENSRVKIVGGN